MEEQRNVDAADALGKLAEPLELTLDDVGGSVSIYGSDPLFPSSVRLGQAFAIAAMYKPKSRLTPRRVRVQCSCSSSTFTGISVEVGSCNEPWQAMFARKRSFRLSLNQL